MTDGDLVTDDQRWLAAAWPFVREHLPPAQAQVLEIGCGQLGGFVPAMRSAGYDAIGVDPGAPDGPDYDRTEFEQHELKEPVDAVVASTSLHHVADLNDVLDGIRSALVPGGTLVVLEWAHERFDEPTARWCFDRLAPPGGEQTWLHEHRESWHSSGQSWSAHIEAHLREEPMHPGRDIVAGLQARFDTLSITEGPYFFTSLDAMTSDHEQAAIDAGQIQATGIRYVGRRGPSAASSA
jgi:SAM-dependent methyltransferase